MFKSTAVHWCATAINVKRGLYKYILLSYLSLLFSAVGLYVYLTKQWKGWRVHSPKILHYGCVYLFFRTSLLETIRFFLNSLIHCLFTL